MPAASTLLPLASYGFLLGWSVAWPPGPINAEMVRRGLAGGFWRAYGLGLGACSGDALWAAALVLGAGLLFRNPTAQLALSVLSTALLLVLAVVFLRGAWRGLRSRRDDATGSRPGRFDDARGGYLLGLGLALSSPWNIAFWLAVIGRPETIEGGAAALLTVTAAVILGAAAWCTILCGAVVALRLRFAGGVWDAIAKGATGGLMLYFAIDGILRLTGA